MLERDVARGWFARRPAMAKNIIQMGTTPPTQSSKSIHGELSATFRGIMRVRTLTHGPSESPSSRLPQLSVKLSHASVTAYSDISHFRTVSAGLSAQRFRWTFSTDACRELLPKSLRIQCPWLGLKEGECYEDPVPSRNWSDKPFVNKCSHTERQKTFQQVSAGAPCLGAPLF